MDREEKRRKKWKGKNIFKMKKKTLSTLNVLYNFPV